jgi:hypothetical protein
MTWLKSVEDTYPLFQPGHLQPPQGRLLRLLDPPELHLKEIALELFIGMVMLELTVHPNIAVETPVPIFMNCLLQGSIGHRRPLEKLQEPVGCGQDDVVVIAVVVWDCVDLLDPRDLVWPVLFGESRNTAIRELLDPVGWLPHPILYRDGKAGALSIAVEYIPLRTFFSRKGGAIINKARPEEFKFFPLSVSLSGPLFAVLLMFMLALLEGADKAAHNVSDGVKVVRDLNGSCSRAGQIDGS